MGKQSADWMLPAEVQSSADARSAVADRVSHLQGEPFYTLLQLTGELVMNAVVHAGGPIGLNLTWDEEEVTIEVTDQSNTRPEMRPVERWAAGGRGLHLVDGLATSWGVQTKKDGKAVWCTLRTA